MQANEVLRAHESSINNGVEVSKAILDITNTLSDQYMILASRVQAYSVLTATMLAHIAKHDPDPRGTLGNILAQAEGIQERAIKEADISGPTDERLRQEMNELVLAAEEVLGILE
ncbi:hypothetical protein [Novosphingobium colocasiae]|nr:hypothetical protein [Novosphingobium colocasiae]